MSGSPSVMVDTMILLNAIRETANPDLQVLSLRVLDEAGEVCLSVVSWAEAVRFATHA